MKKEKVKVNLITDSEIIDLGITGRSSSEVLGQIIQMCQSELRPLRKYEGCIILIYRKKKNAPNVKKIISQRRIVSTKDKEILLTLHDVR